MKYLLLLGTLAMLAAGSLRAQHTFSIVAVDPATGEVGSAGASCVMFDAAIISDVHPGVGAIHTQAAYMPGNQGYGRDLMQMGLAPEVIIDSLVQNDVQKRSDVRQYGVVVLAGGGKSAAFTGANCLDYKAHITGPTYAIQGNILLGQQILDSMEARFLRQPGPLADKLMAALQGANVPGADTRCDPTSSSHAAFIRLARPGDPDEKLYLDLRAVLGDTPLEPIDSLQKLYDAWKSSTNSVRSEHAANALQLDIRPNPASDEAIIHFTLAEPSTVSVTLYDELGRVVRSHAYETHPTGAHTITLDGDSLPAGAYYCRLTAGDAVATRRVVLVGRVR